MYLKPLAEMVRRQGGTVFPAAPLIGSPNDLLLMIDGNVPRGEEEGMYDAIEALLQQYQAMNPGLFTVHHPTHR